MAKRMRRSGLSWFAMAAMLVSLLVPQAAEAQRHRRRHGGGGGGHHGGSSRSPRGSGGSSGSSGSSGSGASSGETGGGASLTGSAGVSASGGASVSSSGGASGASNANGGASAEVPPPPPPAPPPPPSGRRPAALDVAIGGRMFGRFLGYNDDLNSVMRPYQLVAGPMLSAALEWYPGAHFSAGPASWFGLTGSFDYAVGISSQRPSDSMVFNTTAYRFTAGARFRVPFGIGSDVGLGVGYAQLGYSIAPASGMMMTSANSPGIPAVDYSTIRLYASSRLQLHDRVAVLLGIGTMFVLSSGEMGSAAYFRRASVTSLEASLGLAVRVIAGFELRAGVDMHRFGWAMNPQPGDPYIVGGAFDQYYSVFFMAAYRL